MTWGTPVQSFVFLGLLVFELEPMYVTSDRQTDGQTDGRTTDADDRLMPPPPLRGRGHNKTFVKLFYVLVVFIIARQLSFIVYITTAYTGCLSALSGLCRVMTEF